MYALLRLFVRFWLWLLPERGRALLGWERRQYTPPSGRAAGRWGCAARCTASSPGTLCAAEPFAAAAFAQHALAASPGPLTRRRLLLLLSAQDCPPLLNTWTRSLGWHRACPLAHMAELEQAPGRAELLLEEEGCGGERGGCGHLGEGCCLQGEEGSLTVRESCPEAEAPHAGCAVRSPEVVEGCPGDPEVLAERGSGMVPEAGGSSIEDRRLAVEVNGEGSSRGAPVAGSSRAPGAGRGEGHELLAEIGSVGGTSDGGEVCGLPPVVGNVLPLGGCSVVGGSWLATEGGSLGSEATSEVKSFCPGLATEGGSLGPEATSEVKSLCPGVATEGGSLGPEATSEMKSLCPGVATEGGSLGPEATSEVKSFCPGLATEGGSLGPEATSEVKSFCPGLATEGGSLGPEATSEVRSLWPGVACCEKSSLDPGLSRNAGCLDPGLTCELGTGDGSEMSTLAPEPGSHVHITVAIEAVEDDDMDGAFLGGGNCSEDDRNDKYSGAATSGGENDSEDLDPNWTPPEQELIEKLIVQIEYYLSDENLEKDAFLLKHVRRNKMGYVSVKLLTSFKKVKHLTRDWRITAYALRYSDTLELNEDNRKIRRKSPVPVFPSENLPSKMLLVYDFHLFPDLQALNKEQENGGMQEKIMEQLLKVFGSFGVISSVRILKPGRDLPPDVKRFSGRYAQVGTKECAIVEYEEVEGAIKAHEAMGLEKENEVGMKVILIGMKPPKKKILKDKKVDDDSNKNRKAKSLNKRVEELQYTGDESPVSSSSDPDSNPTSPMVERKYKVSNKLSPSTYHNNHLSPNASPRASPWNSPSGQRKVGKISPLADGSSPEFPRKCMDYSSDSSITPSSSPWVQRRRQAQTVTQEKSPVGSPMLGRKIQNADGLPVGVLRLPRGPDGTKGFHNGIERNKPMQNLEST